MNIEELAKKQTKLINNYIDFVQDQCLSAILDEQDAVETIADISTETDLLINELNKLKMKYENK